MNSLKCALSHQLLFGRGHVHLGQFESLKRPTVVSAFCAKRRTHARAENVATRPRTSLEPITNLHLKDGIEKVTQKGSLIANMFLGKFDIDILSYPQIITNQEDFEKLHRQNINIKENFSSLLKNPETLKHLGFDNLWELTTTEIVSVFESIGASCSLTHDQVSAHLDQMHSGVPVSKDNVNPIFTNNTVKLITQMIIQNCIVRNLISCADNQALKEKITDLMNRNPDMKIGYAFSERHPNLGVGFFNEWDSEAELLDTGEWLIAGSKSCILDADYSHYIVFCKTLDYETTIEFPDFDKRPFGMVAFLLPKEVIQTVETFEEHGIRYQKISFPDVTLPAEEIELLKPDLKGTKALNCKGVGQLAVASMILGQLKTSTQTFFDFLANDPRDLMNQQILEKLFVDIARRIYSIESSVYMTAAMFDSYIVGDSELHLEATVTKSMATDYAYDIYRTLQSLYGSKYLITSPLADVIKLYDGFLESSLFNRMLVGLYGVHQYGAYENDHVHKVSLMPFFPRYYFTERRRSKQHEVDKPKLDLHLKSYLGVLLHKQSDMFEYGIKRLNWATEKVVLRWAKEIPAHQVDVHRVGLIASELYKQACVLSRASHSTSAKLMDCDAELYLAKNIVHESWVDVKNLVWECENSPYVTNDMRNEKIHSKNCKYGGYFAYSPLDKVLY